MSSSERVRRFRKRQRKEKDCEELNKFLMNTSFSPTASEDEKICAFQKKKDEEKKMKLQRSKEKDAARARKYRLKQKLEVQNKRALEIDRKVEHEELIEPLRIVEMSSSERVRRFRERQRKEKDSEELNQFLMNTSFSSGTSEDEKIRAFQTKKDEEKKMKLQRSKEKAAERARKYRLKQKFKVQNKQAREIEGKVEHEELIEQQLQSDEMSSSELVRRLNERQYEEKDRKELNQFSMNSLISSTASEDEKIRVFQEKKDEEKKMKLQRSKEKAAERARKHRLKLKAEGEGEVEQQVKKLKRSKEKAAERARKYRLKKKLEVQNKRMREIEEVEHEELLELVRSKFISECIDSDSEFSKRFCQNSFGFACSVYGRHWLKYLWPDRSLVNRTLSRQDI